MRNSTACRGPTLLHYIITFVTSLQEFSPSEIDAHDDTIGAGKVNEEKKRREVVLEMRHAIAKEVTRKSKESQEGTLGSD